MMFKVHSTFIGGREGGGGENYEIILNALRAVVLVKKLQHYNS